MAVKDLKPESVSNFWHKLGSWIAIASATVTTVASVPLPGTFEGANLIIYILGALGAFGVAGDALKTKK